MAGQPEVVHRGLGAALGLAAAIVALAFMVARLRQYGYPYGGRGHCVPPSAA